MDVLRAVSWRGHRAWAVAIACILTGTANRADTPRQDAASGAETRISKRSYPGRGGHHDAAERARFPPARRCSTRSTSAAAPSPCASRAPRWSSGSGSTSSSRRARKIFDFCPRTSRFFHPLGSVAPGLGYKLRRTNPSTTPKRCRPCRTGHGRWQDRNRQGLFCPFLAGIVVRVVQRDEPFVPGSSLFQG